MEKIETTLSVPDVSCDHCVRAINGALGGVAGVEQVRVDIPSKTVSLIYDEKQVSMERIEEVLDDAGYVVAK